MLYNHFTEELLGLQDIIVKNVQQTDKSIKIFIELQRREQDCPCCGASTRAIHDYRTQIIKDIPAFGRIP